jgi:hypothetical protein
MDSTQTGHNYISKYICPLALEAKQEDHYKQQAIYNTLRHPIKPTPPIKKKFLIKNTQTHGHTH